MCLQVEDEKRKYDMHPSTVLTFIYLYGFKELPYKQARYNNISI